MQILRPPPGTGDRGQGGRVEDRCGERLGEGIGGSEIYTVRSTPGDGPVAKVHLQVHLPPSLTEQPGTDSATSVAHLPSCILIEVPQALASVAQLSGYLLCTRGCQLDSG